MQHLWNNTQTSLNVTKKKYLLTEQQYQYIMEDLCAKVTVDQYGTTTISNIYYDTPDHRLISKSLEKPVYKEKLRLRCYGEPEPGSLAFIELKKKYKGIVYKRRTEMPYTQAVSFLSNSGNLPCTQIEKEIYYFSQIQSPLLPAMVIAYERTAMVGKEDPELRITFDKNIRWRDTDLDLTHGSLGIPVLANNTILMEVKIKDALSVEMSHMLSHYQIFPVSFSKRYVTLYD